MRAAPSVSCHSSCASESWTRSFSRPGALSSIVDCDDRTRCPNCRRVSLRMHSGYQRRIADLPWQGRPVMLCVHVRRLRCVNQQCEQRIFAKRAENLAGRHARCTMRLRDIQRSVGLTLGGEAGARLIERLSMRVSADTMLRMSAPIGRSRTVRRAFSALMIGHDGKGSATAPCSSIWRRTQSLICCGIARVRPSRRR